MSAVNLETLKILGSLPTGKPDERSIKKLPADNGTQNTIFTSQLREQT